jgi:hypothetical protein
MRSIGAVTSAQTLSVVGALAMMPSAILGMVAAIADLKRSGDQRQRPSQ